MLAITGPAAEWQISNRKIEKRKGILSVQAEFGFGQTPAAAFQARSGRGGDLRCFKGKREPCAYLTNPNLRIADIP
jgi:hypothetical protein